MTHLDHIIPSSMLEAIPAQIYTILKREFDWQIYQFNNLTCFGVNFMAERTVPIDESETDMITIMTATGDYSNQSVGSIHATPYTFILDFVTKATSKPSKRGDLAATQRLITLMMTVRYILMSPQYITLEMPGFIEGTSVDKMSIYKDERTGNTTQIANGGLIFTVRCQEVSNANAGIALSQAATDIRIEQTSQGFQYQS